MEEIFKDIPNYEGLYQVSNLGNVKSLSRHYLKKGKYDSISKEKILKPSKDGSGYYQLKFFKNAKFKTMKIHQLVAMAFLNHKPNGHKIVVDHIDNDQLNNKLQNLQLISQRQNCSKDKKSGSSHFIGVSWSKKVKKWRSYISINKKLINLGLFSSEIKASEAYQNALKNL